MTDRRAILNDVCRCHDDVAIACLAESLGIPLWNEEQYINGKEAE